jgi:hypothetical protein
MKTIEDFTDRILYYKEQAEKGVYHNPYDVEISLLDILNDTNVVDGRINYEDMAHDTGMLFWSM